MLSKQTKEAGLKFIYDAEIADKAIRELARDFAEKFDELSGRREPDVFDSNKLEEENLLQSYGEGDRFNNHKKKVNRDEQ